MKFYSIIATFQFVVLTTSILDVISELNILMNIKPSECHEKTSFDSRFTCMYNDYKKNVKNKILNLNYLLHYGENTLIYRLSGCGLVLKRAINVKASHNLISKLTQLNHENIVCTYICFYQYIHEQEVVWMLMEYLPIKFSKFSRLTDTQAESVANNIASGLVYLHKNNFAHLNIHKTNIMGNRKSLYSWESERKKFIPEFFEQLKPYIINEHMHISNAFCKVDLKKYISKSGNNSNEEKIYFYNFSSKKATKIQIILTMTLRKITLFLI